MTPEQQAAIQKAQARIQAIEAAKSRLAGTSTAAPAVQAPSADMSVMGRIKDNLIGVDDGVMSIGEKAATALNIGGESMTLGVVGDEAAAAADSLVGRGSYDERLQHHRGQEAALREQNPAVAFAAEVAPAMIPGAGGMKLAQAAGKTVGRLGAGAAIGAGSGALYGFAEGEGGANERLGNAAKTAALGGAFGAIAPKVIDGLAGIPKSVRGLLNRSGKRPDSKVYKSLKNQAYKAVDQSGFKFSPDDMTGLEAKVKSVFDDGTYVEETDTASTAVLKILGHRKDKETTLSQLDTIRKNLWSRYSGAKDQPRILDAIGEIDSLIDSKADASDLMKVAREANSRFAKLQLLENAFQKADDQAASIGSGGNTVNKYRQAVTAIINNEKKAKFFSDEEIKIMREFVRGTPSENMKRLAGKLSPSGNGLMMALQTVGGVVSGGASVPLAVAGAAAKSSAESAALRGKEVVLDAVSGFAMPSAPPQLNALGAGLTSGATTQLESLQMPQLRAQQRTR